jgi:hypothetical protein
MDVSAVIAVIGGIALLVGIFGGGVEAEKIKIPTINNWIRVTSAITGIILIGIAVFLSISESINLPLTTATPTSTALSNTTIIAGNWTGTVVDEGTNYRLEVEIFIEKECEVNGICGTISLPGTQCTANLKLTQIKNEVFIFTEQDIRGEAICVSGGQDSLELLSDGTLSRKFTSADKSIISFGILNRP